MDLFSPQVDVSKMHKAFIRLRANPYDVAVINAWSNGFVTRDGGTKFVTEFQTTFESCLWELYLHAVLQELKCQIDFSHTSPDFCITDPSRFTIEAVVAKNAKGQPSAVDVSVSEPPEDLNVFNRRSILRLSNSISAKFKLYNKSYAKLNHVRNKPFVIAIASFDQPFSSVECQRCIEATLFDYYVDEEQFLVNPDDDAPLEGRNHGPIKNHNGSDINLGLFNNDAMGAVSAVIYNTCSIWGKVRALSSDPNQHIYFQTLRYNPTYIEPHHECRCKSEYHESILDGLRIYHNPFADHPLDPAFFRNSNVFQYYYDNKANQWVTESASNSLLFRNTLLLTFTGHNRDT